MDVQTLALLARPQLAARRGSGRLLTAAAGALTASLLAAGCTPPAPVEATGDRPAAECVCPAPTATPVATAGVAPFLEPARFSDLPGWGEADAGPARQAFLTSCRLRLARADADAPVSRTSPYGGRMEHWRTACAAMEAAAADPRSAFEAAFRPWRVTPDGDGKLTGYYEPEFEVRRSPEPPFDRAVPAPPDDLVSVDLGEFEAALAGRRVWGRVEDGALRLYPDRASITAGPEAALAWGRDADVFYLQIQGSGRLRYPDGETVRAAFAAHNHRPFRSVVRQLIDTGVLPAAQAGMEDVKAWIESADPGTVKAALGFNPRYVWFRLEPVADPAAGPKGAEGVPLTAMGSLAVDPDIHPFGAPMFLNSRAPDARTGAQAPLSALVVAQDSGGAIKGRVRGDLFVGGGEAAGRRAAAVNAPLDLWVLLPSGYAPEAAEP